MVRRDGLETDHLVAAQGLEKGLKAAVNKTAQEWTVDFHFADSRCAPYLLRWRGADETNLHSPYRQLIGHAPEPKERDERGESVK
jgi:hypothetical protein